MITEFIFDLIFNVVYLIISLFPNIGSLLNSFSVGSIILKFLQIGLFFTGTQCLVIPITMFVSFYGVSITWSAIEWCYKKIPGVD